MERTMTFRELVRKIHPDINPNITDAGSKMNDAVLFKNAPTELYKLAIRWGLMGVSSNTNTSDTNTSRPRPRPVRYQWRAFLRERPVVNGHVCVNTLGGIRVMVVRVTPKRVYFYRNGRRTYASIKNIHVVREVRV